MGHQAGCWAVYCKLHGCALNWLPLSWYLKPSISLSVLLKTSFSLLVFTLILGDIEITTKFYSSGHTLSWVNPKYMIPSDKSSCSHISSTAMYTTRIMMPTIALIIFDFCIQWFTTRYSLYVRPMSSFQDCRHPPGEPCLDFHQYMIERATEHFTNGSILAWNHTLQTAA